MFMALFIQIMKKVSWSMSFHHHLCFDHFWVVYYCLGLSIPFPTPASVNRLLGFHCCVLPLHHPGSKVCSAVYVFSVQFLLINSVVIAPYCPCAPVFISSFNNKIYVRRKQAQSRQDCSAYRPFPKYVIVMQKFISTIPF